MKKNITVKRMAVSTVLALIPSLSIWAGDLVHNPSGITFPANIEHRFTLGPVEDGAANTKKLTVYYLYNDGRRVIVNVHPAPKEAHGPTLLDGDSKSDATPAFMKEFENLKNKYLKKDDSLA